MMIEIAHAQTEFLHQSDGQTRRSRQDFEQVVAQDEIDLGVGFGRRRRRPRLVVQHGHFAKEIAGPKAGKHAALVLPNQAGDLHLALDNDVEAIARIALLKDVASGLVRVELGGLFQGLQFGSEHAAEQFVVLEDNHRPAVYRKDQQRKAQRWRGKDFRDAQPDHLSPFSITSARTYDFLPEPDARIFQGWRRPAGGAMFSRRNLFLRRKIGATLRAGKHLVRIAAVLRIKHTTQRAHRVEVVLGELLLHEIYLFHTDAVLARHAAAEFNALVQNVVARRERAFHLIGIALIIQHQGMNIAVAGVKDIRDAQAVFPARRADEAHDLGQLRARHHAVLGEIIRTEPADSAERAFAAFPEQSAFVVVVRQTHFAGSIRFADFDDAL